MLANTEKLTFKARLRIEYFPNIMLNYFIIRKNYDSGGQTLKSELFKGSLRYKKMESPEKYTQACKSNLLFLF